MVLHEALFSLDILLTLQVENQHAIFIHSYIIHIRISIEAVVKFLCWCFLKLMIPVAFFLTLFNDINYCKTSFDEIA